MLCMEVVPGLVWETHSVFSVNVSISSVFWNDLATKQSFLSHVPPNNTGCLGFLLLLVTNCHKLCDFLEWRLISLPVWKSGHSQQARMYPISLPALRSLAPSQALFSGLSELPKASCIPELGTAFSYHSCLLILLLNLWAAGLPLFL